MKSLLDAHLTIRELDVFGCIVRGKAHDDQIVRELGLSIDGVRSYVSRLRAKGVIEGRSSGGCLSLTEAGYYLVEQIGEMFTTNGDRR